MSYKSNGTALEDKGYIKASDKKLDISSTFKFLLSDYNYKGYSDYFIKPASLRTLLKAWGTDEANFDNYTYKGTTLKFVNSTESTTIPYILDSELNGNPSLKWTKALLYSSSSHKLRYKNGYSQVYDANNGYWENISTAKGLYVYLVGAGGGGGGGFGNWHTFTGWGAATGGGGGGSGGCTLCYLNLSAYPGEEFELIIGQGGQGGQGVSPVIYPTSGGATYIKRQNSDDKVVIAYGGGVAGNGYMTEGLFHNSYYPGSGGSGGNASSSVNSNLVSTIITIAGTSGGQGGGPVEQWINFDNSSSGSSSSSSVGTFTVNPTKTSIKLSVSSRSNRNDLSDSGWSSYYYSGKGGAYGGGSGISFSGYQTETLNDIIYWYGDGGCGGCGDAYDENQKTSKGHAGRNGLAYIISTMD